MCTIFSSLHETKNRVSFFVSFCTNPIRNKTSRKRKEKEKNESDTKRLLNDVECSNMKRKSIFKTQELANATQLKKKYFFPLSFLWAQIEKIKMLATTWLGSILSLTKKATQNKNARLSFFHVPSQTNCFSNTYKTRTKAENLTRPKSN